MQRRDGGFALFIVVALLALMAAAVIDFVALAQTDLRATRNTIELARARALAESGYALALNELLNPVPGNAPPTDGRKREVALDDGRITLAVEDEAGKLDLNWAPIELLEGLLDSLEVSGAAEGRIVDAVTARRAGAPLPRYAPGDIAAGGPMGGPTLERLAKRPFSSVDALKPLAQIDEPTFERIRPALTVYSESRRINLAAATRPVLMALPDMTAAIADAMLAARESGTAGGLRNASALQADYKRYAAAGSLRAATIIADAVTGTGMRFRRVAVVSFTGVPTAPVRILEWREE